MLYIIKIVSNDSEKVKIYVFITYLHCIGLKELMVNDVLSWEPSAWGQRTMLGNCINIWTLIYMIYYSKFTHFFKSLFITLPFFVLLTLPDFITAILKLLSHKSKITDASLSLLGLLEYEILI